MPWGWVTQSSDRASIKYGLSVMGLFRPPPYFARIINDGKAPCIKGTTYRIIGLSEKIKSKLYYMGYHVVDSHRVFSQMCYMFDINVRFRLIEWIKSHATFFKIPVQKNVLLT